MMLRVIGGVVALIVFLGLAAWIAQPAYNKWKAEQAVAAVENKVADAKVGAIQETNDAEVQAVNTIAKGQTRRAEAVAGVNAADDSGVYNALLVGVCDTTLYYNDPACVRYRSQSQGQRPANRPSPLPRRTTVNSGERG